MISSHLVVLVSLMAGWEAYTIRVTNARVRREVVRNFGLYVSYLYLRVRASPLRNYARVRVIIRNIVDNCARDRDITRQSAARNVASPSREYAPITRIIASLSRGVN